MTDGFGAITWWGFSPALDLQDADCITALKELKLDKHDCTDEVSILLVGSGDIRHILQTAARSHRHNKHKLHFYVMENSLELYARDMLFLTIALEPQKRMGLQEKTELFLELYGNILVRKQSAEYVEKMSNEFIKMVTDFDYLEKKLPVIDLSQLKFKERDFLEGIFKLWRNPDTKVFDVEKLWDFRVRTYLGTRYDTKMNAFDWNYHMGLAVRDADIINTHEYKNWRNKGNAFEIREANYDTPNKTLASGLVTKHEGDRIARRGYWGDILVSPYVAFGIESEEKSFFKKANNAYTTLSQNVAEYNVLSLFHELVSKEKYVAPVKEDENPGDDTSKGATLTEIKEEDEETKKNDVTLVDKEEKNNTDKTSVDKDNSAKHQTTMEQNPLDIEYEPVPLDNINVTFLPLNSIQDLPKKSKYKKLFQTVYFSNSLVHLLTPDVSDIFADKASVVLESAKYMLELKLEQIKEFHNKVTGMARAAGCEVAGKIDPEKDTFLKFLFERQNS